MKPFDVLAEKPWIHRPAVAGGESGLPHADPAGAARVATRFLFAVVGVLFFLFIITFLSRSQYPDFQALAGAPWQPFSDPTRLWFNTAVLALASLALHAGLAATRRGRMNLATACISAAVFLTLGFLLAQYTLWQQLRAQGFYASANPANAYFYLLTAVHGLHLVGGLVVLAHVVLRGLRDGDAASLAGPLRLCSQYWHFLLGIWLVLFALLASRPETINALAALCGF